MYDYLIVGAGLTGCVIARQLTDAGKKCLVVDKRNYVGGNCHTINVCGIDVHQHGAHIFRTNDKTVVDYIERFTQIVPFVNTPIAVNGDKVMNLPFNMNTFAQLFGVKTPEEARKRIAEQTEAYKKKQPVTLQEYALSVVGKTVYDLLIRQYTQKQWGVKCTELPKEIMSYIPVRYTYDNNYFNQMYQFVPKCGYTALFQRILEGINLRLQYEAKMDDTSWMNEAKRIIWTGMIDQFFEHKLGKLDYRSVDFRHEIVHGCGNMQGVAVMNYTSHEVPYTRTIEHGHFIRGSKHDDSVITYQTPIAYAEGKIPYYPVNDLKNEKLYGEYAKLAKTCQRVTFAGRLGTYSFDNMEKAIKAAMRIAKKELER